MKHLAAILAALLAAALGAYVIVVNAKGITTVHLIGGGVLLFLAFALAIPAQLTAALEALAPYARYLPGVKVPAALPQASAAPDVHHDDGGAT